MPLGTFDRDDNLALLGTGTFDLLVVGGGITGAGVALDAAARGLRTALVERDDFAPGTSSKSSKLVHGGLRYLQNGDVRLVYEALRERQRLLRNAPHLVTVLPFLIPVFTGREGLIPKQVARALGSAMWMYDLTGGLRIGKVHKRLRQEAARAHMPTLDDRLAWAYLYYDAQTDDARLTLAIARTAALDFGAVVVNHAGVTGLRRTGDRITGAVVDTGAGVVEVDARVVVNATGGPTTCGPSRRAPAPTPSGPPRASTSRCRGTGCATTSPPSSRSRRTAGRVAWCPGSGADGRVGGGLRHLHRHHRHRLRRRGRRPHRTPDDVAYLLGALNRLLREPLSESDVLATWAGLRPLVGDRDGRTADLSRRHRVTTSPGGMVTVTGASSPPTGRWPRTPSTPPWPRSTTPFPAVPDAAAPASSPCAAPRAGTRPGSPIPTWPGATAASPASSRPWWRPTPRWPSRWSPGCPIGGSRPCTRPATRWPPRSTTLSCRTRARLRARDATAAAAGEVATLLAGELGWSEHERAAQVTAYRAAAEREREVPGLPESVVLAGGV